MQYFFVIFSGVLSGLCGIFQKKVALHSDSKRSSLLLCTFCFVPLALIFGIAALATGKLVFNFYTVVPAVFAGTAMAISIYFYLESLKGNAYAIPVIIVNLNFVFPIILSIIFLREPTKFVQLIGMCLAIAMIIIMNFKSGNQKNTFKAIIAAMVASIANGVVNFAIKVQGYCDPHDNKFSFFFITYIIAAVIGLFGLIGNRSFKIKKVYFANGVSVAVCVGGVFLMGSLLSTMMNAAAVFTISAAISILVSLALGCIRFKEKLSARELISVGFCGLAIACQYLNLA